MELASEGVDVAIAARGEVALEETARDIAAETGRRIIPIVADTTQWEDVQNMVESTVAGLGGVDILVNSATMVGGQVRGMLAEATEKDLIEDLDT